MKKEARKELRETWTWFQRIVWVAGEWRSELTIQRGRRQRFSDVTRVVFTQVDYYSILIAVNYIWAFLIYDGSVNNWALSHISEIFIKSSKLTQKFVLNQFFHLIIFWKWNRKCYLELVLQHSCLFMGSYEGVRTWHRCLTLNFGHQI